MTADATKARKDYMREYRQRNKERLNEYRKDWAKRNPEKIKAYTEKQWERFAERNKKEIL